MAESVTIGGIVVLVISSIGGWIKIYRDTKKTNGNGEVLKNIDKNVDDMKVDIGGIKKDVKNQEKRCGQITKSFEKQIEDNRNRIFNLKK